MRQANRKSAKPDAHDFVAHLATGVVRAGLAATLRKRPKHFVVTLVVPDHRRLLDYGGAADTVLEEYSVRTGYEDFRQKTLLLDGARKRVQADDLDFERVIVITRSSNIDAALELCSDRIVSLPDVRFSDVRKAVRAILKEDIGDSDVALVAEADWSDLHLAFRPGRSLAAALARLRHKVTGNARDPADGPNPTRRATLHEMYGYGEAAAWGIRLARDLADWRAGTIGWQDVDKGILLAGPPGVGKTVFARALANTCDTDLVLGSMASWQAAGYLNDLLKSMRSTFDEARRKAPAVLFVDELDAIGSRENARGDNASYHRQVINCFLELVDGSESREGVVVVGATNRPSEIDEAILRPGRLETVVQIPMPDVSARIGILKWHSGLVASPTSRFASETEGWTGAKIEALLRKAKREARESRTGLSIDLVEKHLPETMPLSAQVLWRVAVHECGHALVGRFLAVGEFKGVTVRKSVPIDAERMAGGQTSFEVRSQIRTCQSYVNHIALLLGGIAAETVVFGNFSDGCSGAPGSDLCRARDIATEIVAGLGMDEFLITSDSLDADMLAQARVNPRVWGRVDQLLRDQFTRAVTLLTASKELLVMTARHVDANLEMSPEVLQALIGSPAAVPHGRQAVADEGRSRKS